MGPHRRSECERGEALDSFNVGVDPSMPSVPDATDSQEPTQPVYVENKRWGPLFGYTGSFQVEWREVGKGGVPAGILP
jgi:hypothetical protein